MIEIDDFKADDRDTREEVDADWSGLGYCRSKTWWNTESGSLPKLQRGWGCGTIQYDIS